MLSVYQGCACVTFEEMIRLGQSWVVVGVTFVIGILLAYKSS